VPGFPALLQRHRRALRLSQVALAQRAGLSQRHLSFLETGRARPGPRALEGLAAALLLEPADIADLLAAAAGQPAARPEPCWDDEGLAGIRAICRTLLERHEPWPAYVTTAGGRLLMANGALDRLLDLAGGADLLWARTGRRNIHDLTFHPLGLGPHLAEQDSWVPHVLQRLRRAAVTDAEAAETLARVLRHPATRGFAGTADVADEPVIAEAYVLDGRRLRFLALLTRFGSPGDRIVAGLQIECLFPADTATERLPGGPDGRLWQDGPASNPPARG
jgi:transcriptional regulator with XRE-family HTH domain